MAAPPLGKYFASTEKTVRDKAIKQLSEFLSDSDNVLPPSEIAKLWKGIFYCFWMSDKPLVQQALASELAELIITITSPSASLAFLDGFWQCHVREWGGIDRLRLDKYLMLVRRFVNATFRFLIREGWSKDAVEEYNDILSKEGGPLHNTPKTPISLQYHFCDIYMEELGKALAKSDSKPVPVCTLLSPFILLAARTPKAPTYARIENVFLRPVLSELSPEQDEDEQPRAKRVRLDQSVSDSAYSQVLSNACGECKESSKPLEKGVLRVQLLRRIFAKASEPETQAASRRRFYALYNEMGSDLDDE
ncbi:Nop52-domain-containing protein [Cylindrobasidium torrendii FP15055 ss-10]|uniref:Nop52-domain-containing protein n=1 Tax=Cylindrobasidium torrendii FP15055 ss-10 TaxID=1314674 RepID=A0A0D7BAG6_9AGAR|nr:Nop52-domain-containing protein [Cylindrobasidium torrendii FP15055 ss-10]